MPIEPVKNLPTLKQHNLRIKRAGVLCDKCKTEMVFRSWPQTASNPKLGHNVECTECGHSGVKL